MGIWAERPLYQSPPEDATLGFSSDGTGWMYWASWSTGFEAQVFTWSARDAGVLVVRVHTELGGTWSMDDRKRSVHDMETVELIDAELTWKYQIVTGVNYLGEPAVILHLDHPFTEGLTGNTFSRVIEPGPHVPLPLLENRNEGPTDPGNQGP
ncbi:hypothetical protein [Parafrankia sp. FMc2]|uniref:hypothetical protein n=1 Tax=Parafrankia sp. FMc2 TaxID=3233196 RepID=UPI0034D72FDE